MKKKLSILLICLLIFSILPIEQFIIFAGTSSFEPDETHAREWFEAGSTAALEKIEEAKSYLIGVEETNIKNQVLNVITYAMYGIAVYGYPFGDKKTPAQFPELSREEYRYLGYDENGDEVTNSKFPDDVTGDSAVTDKDWQIQSDNYGSWKKAGEDTDLIERMLTVKGIRHTGDTYDLSIMDVLSNKTTLIEQAKKYANLQTICKFSIWGSIRIWLLGGDGHIYYWTFDIPPLAGDKTLKAEIETEDNEYTIERGESYIDIPVTVTGEIATSDSFLESYIENRWVTFEGTQISQESYTFIKRIYKDDLSEGENEITLTGKAGIQSYFEGDSPITDEASTKVDIFVASEEEKLAVRLDVPESAGINEAYTVEDISYIPDVPILSSTLTKKVGSARESEVKSWTDTTKSITESSPVKTTIKYTLTIILEDGQVDSDTKSIEIIDARNVEATADLELDAYTYEGHPTYAKDVSVFDVDGEIYSAKRAYEENLAHNHFDVVDDTPHDLDRLSDTKAKIIFEEAGWYNVELEVETKDDQELYDTESIEVRSTPYINALVGGTQKQNRKQILNISAGIHPEYPITSFWVEIEDTDTGEKVHLTSSKKNSTHIKTRDITTKVSDYFQNYTLEFLTKNDTQKVYAYTVYVKDAKGDTDTISDYFTVYPDQPPVAQMDVADSFLRNQDSNVADITVEDRTVSSDGDQVERTWKVASDTDHDSLFTDETYVNVSTLGYTDLSFGSMQKIQFPKTGVGKADIRLNVKEVWTEPTLAEYVTEADHLTGYTTATTEVKNVAPLVSIEPVDTFSTDILVLDTQNNDTKVKNNLSTLETLLKENNIDADMNVQTLGNEMEMSDGPFFELSDDFGYRDFPSKQVLVDNQYLYVTVASGLKEDPDNRYYTYDSVKPYIIEAYNLESATKKWTYTMGEDENNFSLKKDHNEKYLFVNKEDETTLILNRDTGAYIGNLSFEAKGDIYATDKNIYFFCDGYIKKYNLSKGTLDTVQNEGCSETCMIDGRVEFVSVDQYNKPFRGIYELDTDAYTREYIELIDKDKQSYDMMPQQSGMYVKDFNIKAIDHYGTVLITQDVLDVSDYNNAYIIAWVVSKENKIIKSKCIGARNSSSYDKNLGMIKDMKGQAQYLFYGYSEGDNEDLVVSIYEIYGNRSVTKTLEDDAGYDSRPYAGISTDEYIYLFCGGTFTYSSRERSHTIKVRISDFSASTTNMLNDSSWDEDYSVSDLYLATVYDDDRDDEDPTTRRIDVYKLGQNFDDLFQKTVQKNARFHEGSQKYVITLDDTFNTDTTFIQGVIDKLRALKAKFIYVGEDISSNPNSYGSRIVSQVGRDTIEYENNMNLNFNRISNLITSLADKVKNSVKTTITNSDTVKLRKTMDLDPFSKYWYEYDIKYAKDYTSKNKNILSVNTGVSNVSNYGLRLYSPSSAGVQDYAYLEDVLYEDFNGSLVNPALELTNDDDDPCTKTNGFFGTTHVDGRTSNSGEIRFNMEKDGFVFFDVKGELSSNDKVYFKIRDNGDEKLYFSSEEGIEIYPYASAYYYAEAGEHTLKLNLYSDRHDTNDSWGGIDNFEIKYLVRKGSTSTRDTGVSPESRLSSIKADEWYSVKNTFRTPAEDCQLVNIPEGRTVVEDWEDDTIQPIIGYFGLERENGIMVTPDRKPNGRRYRKSGVTVTVPEGHVVHVKLDVWTARDGSTTPIYYSGNLGDKDYTDDQDVTFDMDLPAGKHTFGADLEYGDDNYIHAKFKDITITDKGYYTDDGENYFLTKKSKETSTVNLLLGNTVGNTQISNFKLYKTVNGKDYLVLKDDFIDSDDFNDTWDIIKNKSTSKVELAEESTLTEDENAPMVYSKGQLIKYNVYYDDYENDPSKKQYWQYTHTPFNDGPHPDAGKILNKPIERFYIDGKYTVKHWQEDNTGVSVYDKKSNVEEIMFYVQGNAVAPEITYIKTLPNKVKEGDDYKIEVGVWDEDLDVLDTKIELYKNNTLIYTYTQDDVAPTDREYPPIISDYAPMAAVGKYTIVATASDDTGTGIDSYNFTVISEGNVEGMVMHTDRWNENRKKYNLSKSGNEDEPRGYNVFWSGEKFVLRAETEGKPNKVHVEILDEGYETYLSSEDQINWNGYIAEESMVLDGTMSL